MENNLRVADFPLKCVCVCIQAVVSSIFNSLQGNTIDYIGPIVKQAKRVYYAPNTHAAESRPLTVA